MEKKNKLPAIPNLSDWLGSFQADLNKHIANISAFPIPYLQQVQDEIDRESKKEASDEDVHL